MKWIYEQATGRLSRDGKLVSVGYAGAPGHINSTASEGIRNKGPIPRGLWRMTQVFAKHPRLGPAAIALVPVGHTALGRSDFLIHADSIAKPGRANYYAEQLKLGIIDLRAWKAVLRAWERLR